jgi:hypothetical protein
MFLVFYLRDYSYAAFRAIIYTIHDILIFNSLICCCFDLTNQYTGKPKTEIRVGVKSKILGNMENFNVTNVGNPLLLQVGVSSIYKAKTTGYLVINNNLIKPPVTQSEDYENGSIDLDTNQSLIWKSIGSSNTFKGNTLTLITMIYYIPGDLDTNEKVKKFILNNIKINYALKETSTASILLIKMTLLH